MAEAAALAAAGAGSSGAAMGGAADDLEEDDDDDMVRACVWVCCLWVCGEGKRGGLGLCLRTSRAAAITTT